jgi:hypothetical protein
MLRFWVRNQESKVQLLNKRTYGEEKKKGINMEKAQPCKAELRHKFCMQTMEIPNKSFIISRLGKKCSEFVKANKANNDRLYATMCPLPEFSCQIMTG